MSDIKIQPSATGSGTVTITAPTTNTARVITLPDSAGTLLDENSSVPSANLTGALPAISGASLTSVNAVNTGRKNMLINGGFDVWQRGTTGTAQGYNSADRWYISRGGGSPTVSITRETFATTETDIKSKYYLQWVQSTGGTTPYIVQRVEEIKPFLGQEVTVSVWMKAASAVTIDLDVYIDYGDAQSTTLDENTSFSVTTSWQKFQHTFTISSGGTVAANSNLEVRFSPPDSNTITTYFAEAQLEYGSVATDFEHRSYGEELALCQRYYYAHSDTAGQCVGGAGGFARSATQIRTALSFPVTMRSSPSLSAGSGTNYYKFEHSSNTIYATTLGLTNTNNKATEIYASVSGATQGDARTFALNSGAAYVSFDSEL